MSEEFLARNTVGLAPRVTIQHPVELPELVHLDDPAVDVFTDFRRVPAVTASPDVPIDDALEQMKVSGVRLLLVTDEDETVIGIVTASDIQGEVPINLSRSSGKPRASITVAAIMVPREEVVALKMETVEGARVGHIVETLRVMERRHVIVVENGEGGIQQVRGLFSASQVSKQLGRDVTEVMTPAHSLSELLG